jgi:predicted nucleic acid binding AN1-type Zn finger protein
MSLTITIPQSTLNISSFSTPNAESKKSRCQCCTKKLGLTGFACRCGGNFCAAHRADTLHNCTFDYKAEAHTYLSTSLEKVVAKKVDRI